MTSALETIEPMKQAIAVAVEAGDVDTLNDTRSMATGLQKAAKARGLGISQENKAAEIVLRAERGIGQVLLALPREPGGLNSSRVQLTPLQEALDSLGMLGAGGTGRGPNATAQRFMALARMPDDVFEDMLAAVKAKAERIAKVDFYRGASESKPKPKDDGVLDHGDPALSLVRSATYMLLGYTVNDEGVGVYDPAAGSIQRMAWDNLTTLAGFIKTLADGYNEERKRRGN